MEPELKRYHHGNLRQELVEHALVFLNAHDQHDLSLREMAREIGVSPNAPYRHFKTKDDLLASLAEFGFGQLGHALNEVREEGPMKRFRALGDAFARFAVQHRALFRIMFSPHRERVTLESARETCFGILAESVRMLMDETSVNDKVRQGSIAAWSLFYGFSTLASDQSIPMAAELTPPDGREIARTLARGLRD